MPNVAQTIGPRSREPGIDASVLQRIGGTPLLELRGIVPEGCARILVKVESANPTGSMKDRMALAMIAAGERTGQLKPGGRVVEYTGGSTGVSLALVCAARGYPLSIVTSDAFSAEKRNHMAALGAELTLVPSAGGGMDAALTRAMIEAAREITERTGAFWTDQLNNTNQLTAYHTMAEETWEQTGGRLDAFVQSTGTAACVRGVAEVLRRNKPDIHIVAVEPKESAVLSGGTSGVHRIEGVGAGFVVPLWHASIADAIATVSTEEAMAMARRLARADALFAGTSTGANLVAAIELGKRLGKEATVVTVMCDSGLKYVSTRLYDGVPAQRRSSDRDAGS
jgi:cysteine synthase